MSYLKQSYSFLFLIKWTPNEQPLIAKLQDILKKLELKTYVDYICLGLSTA